MFNSYYTITKHGPMRNWSKHTTRLSLLNQSSCAIQEQPVYYHLGTNTLFNSPLPFFPVFPLLFFSRASVTTFTQSEHDHQGGMMHMHSSYRVGLDMGAMISQEQLFKHREIVGTPSVQHKPPSVSSAVKLHS